MDLLNRENVQLCDSAADWKDAVRISTRPLEKSGCMESRYCDAIIANVERLGPYILIGENIALPHARPEEGVLKPQLAVTLFREPVLFSNGESARLFVTLAAKDNDSHLDALQGLMNLLTVEENLEKILAAEDADTLFRLFG